MNMNIVTRNTTEPPKHRRIVSLNPSLNTLNNIRLWREWRREWKRRQPVREEDVRDVVEEVDRA